MHWRALFVILLGACGPAVSEPAAARSGAPVQAAARSVAPVEASARSGAPVEAPVVEAPVVERTVESDPTNPPGGTTDHTLEIDGDHALGCGLLPTRRRRLIRRLPTASANSLVTPDHGGIVGTPVPLRNLRGLRPHFDSVYLAGPDGMCEPRRGEGRVSGYGGRGWLEVSEAMAGCPRMSEIAWIDCQPPPWLRYERLPYRIEPLPRSGESDDPRVRSSIDDTDAILRYLDEIDVEPPAGWRRSLRRRTRIAEVILEEESFSIVETHWQIGDACPRESATRDVFVRVAGSAEWAPVRDLGGLPLGVYHDGRRVLGLEIRGLQEPRLGRPCGGVIEGGSDCRSVGIVARSSFASFERAVNLHYGFTRGQYERPDGAHPLLRSDPDCYR